MTFAGDKLRVGFPPCGTPFRPPRRPPQMLADVAQSGKVQEEFLSELRLACLTSSGAGKGRGLAGKGLLGRSIAWANLCDWFHHPKIEP